MSKTRREYSFPIVQTPEITDYVPQETRDEARAAMFKGHSGIVIPWQQKVGSDAELATFTKIVNSANEADVKEVSDLFATVSIGTAYHLFAQTPQHEVMFRRGKLPDMHDRLTLEALTSDKLVNKIQRGLMDAVELATEIEAIILGDRNPRLIDGREYDFGKLLLTTGLGLAALGRDITAESGSAERMQSLAWRAGETAYRNSIELTDEIGTRATVAQIPDPASPLMRHLHDNIDSVSQPVYLTLVAEARRLADEYTLPR